MTQATTTYAAVQTQPDGGTMSSIKVPPGVTKISTIGALVVIDGAWTVDTGNNFTLKFTGTGITDGQHEINIGALSCQETGTSVTGSQTVKAATYIPVDIAVKAGEISLSAAYDGTDPGTPFIAVTVGFD